MYDIVNILESVSVVSKKAKNTYVWHGTGPIPSTLKALQVREKTKSRLDIVISVFLSLPRFCFLANHVLHPCLSLPLFPSYSSILLLLSV